MKGGDLYKANSKVKKQSKIPKESKKTHEQRERYKDQAKRFFNEAVASGTNICIFCGEKVSVFQGLHHWKGRTGKYLLDKEWWSIVHNDCHVFKYHKFTVKQMTEAWGQAFWDRLEKFNSSLREKIQGRAHKLTPTLFDDSE